MSFYDSPPPPAFPPRRDPHERVPRPTPRGGSPTLLILFILLGILLGVLAYRFWPFGRRGDVTEPDATLRVAEPRGNLWEIEQGIVKLAGKASKSVLHIRAQNSDQGSVATGSGF